MPEKRVLLKRIGTPNSERLATYLADGGYEALSLALKKLSPVEVLDMVKRSGLRGRGGAGFPTGMKWQFGMSDPKHPKYIICNADEGEPGTFKDRPLLENDPHSILEGMALAGFVVGAEQGIIYIRGEYRLGMERLRAAMAEAEAQGYLGENILDSGFNFRVELFEGAGSYICGEETALLESLEGRVGRSRTKPPFPVNEGLWGKPTIVNNVETLVNIPLIVAHGVEWFQGLGTPGCPGTKIYSLSGHVKRPGNYELPMGSTVQELIYEYGGGIRGDRRLKAFLPGGASSPCLTPDKLGTRMDFHYLALAGSMLGSGAVVVMDEETCLVGASLSIARFFAHESCGRCTPCREGVLWMEKLLERIYSGEAASPEIDLVVDLGQNMRAGSFCPFGIAAPNAALSFIAKFRQEFEDHIKYKKCTVREAHA